MTALRLSLTYGHGDTRWFDKLPREEQVRVLAYESRDKKPKGGGGNKGEAILAKLLAKRAAEGGS